MFPSTVSNFWSLVPPCNDSYGSYKPFSGILRICSQVLWNSLRSNNIEGGKRSRHSAWGQLQHKLIKHHCQSLRAPHIEPVGLHNCGVTVFVSRDFWILICRSIWEADRGHQISGIQGAQGKKNSDLDQCIQEECWQTFEICSLQWVCVWLLLFFSSFCPFRKGLNTCDCCLVKLVLVNCGQLWCWQGEETVITLNPMM